jgi:hypothetical protein
MEGVKVIDSRIFTTAWQAHRALVVDFVSRKYSTPVKYDTTPTTLLQIIKVCEDDEYDEDDDSDEFIQTVRAAIVRPHENIVWSEMSATIEEYGSTQKSHVVLPVDIGEGNGPYSLLSTTQAGDGSLVSTIHFGYMFNHSETPLYLLHTALHAALRVMSKVLTRERKSMVSELGSPEEDMVPEITLTPSEIRINSKNMEQIMTNNLQTLARLRTTELSKKPLGRDILRIMERCTYTRSGIYATLSELALYISNAAVLTCPDHDMFETDYLFEIHEQLIFHGMN